MKLVRILKLTIVRPFCCMQARYLFDLTEMLHKLHPFKRCRIVRVLSAHLSHELINGIKSLFVHPFLNPVQDPGYLVGTILVKG